MILNLDVAFILFREDTSKIIIPLLGLVSAPTIGFLTSQFWWCIYSQWEKFRFSEKISCRNQQPELKWILNNMTNYSEKDYNRTYNRTVIAYVYCVNAVIKKNEKSASEYITRRWDVYHTLGATSISIILAIVLKLIRIIFNFIPPTSLILSQELFDLSKQFCIFGVITGLIWFIVGIYSLNRPRKQWETMSEFILNQHKEKIAKLKIPENWKTSNG